MALTTLTVMLALSLGATSIMLVIAARVGASPNREPSTAVPANATMLRAWLAIALRPSRRTIVAWAHVADRSWVVTSLIVATGWAMVINGYDYVIRGLIWPRPLPKGEHYLF